MFALWLQVMLFAVYLVLVALASGSAALQPEAAMMREASTDETFLLNSTVPATTKEASHLEVQNVFYESMRRIKIVVALIIVYSWFKVQGTTEPSLPPPWYGRFGTDTAFLTFQPSSYVSSSCSGTRLEEGTLVWHNRGYTFEYVDPTILGAIHYCRSRSCLHEHLHEHTPA